MDSIESMTDLEKVRVMEQLWNALTRNEDFPTPPEWHHGELQRRQSRIQEGQERYIGLDQLKERGPKK